jgi:hypothetical protein
MNSSVSNGDSCDIAALKYISSIYMEVLYYSAYFKNILLDTYSNI